MTGRFIVPLRVAAVTATAAVVVAMTSFPSAAADGDVQVINTETVQVYTSPTGEVETKRIYEQLALTGTGSVDLKNPISTDGLRNLDGFGGFDVEDGNQITKMTVDGEQHLRSVSDYQGKLPLDVSVQYILDGKRVEPGDVVGEDGKLEVKYIVKNVTGVDQEVSFPDGAGGTVTKTVNVPIPMVGSVTTTAPANFTEVKSPGANMAGDGKGGTKLSFTMTLFPPIGSDTAEFGYIANITDGVVPRTSISALPVNPMQSPTFKTAADSYKGGADTGLELTDGATQIDANLLKLRDGAGDLLAGLIKLRDGAQQLEAGLAGEAAPGASRLAEGAAELNGGLGRINSGSKRLAAGTDEAYAGGQELASGLGELKRGAGDLNGGLGQLADGGNALSAGFNSPTGEMDLTTGSAALVDGLELISGGLGQLTDAQTGLPAAKAGAEALNVGVDRLLVGLGDPANEDSLIGGLTKVDAGLGGAKDGAQAIADGAAKLAGGLPTAKGGVDTVLAGLSGASAKVNALAANAPHIATLLGMACAELPAGHPLLQVCAGVGGLGTDIAALNQGLADAVTGLGRVSGGLQDAIDGAGALNGGAGQLLTGLTALEIGTSELLIGMNQLKGGISNPACNTADPQNATNPCGLKQGLGLILAGMDKAIPGLLQLSAGGQSAVAGATTLAESIVKAGAGAQQLADGLGTANAGSSKLAAGAAKAEAGGQKLSSGLGQLDGGANELSDGVGQAADGSGQLSDGANQLADGLTDAADGSGQLAGGLEEAAGGAPQLVDGAQRLSDEGTSKLVDAGESTAQNYGEMYATIAAGAERADSEKMAFGAPEGAIGLTAYSYEIKGDDGEGGRNLARGLGGLAVLAAGAGAFALRRRLI